MRLLHHKWRYNGHVAKRKACLKVFLAALAAKIINLQVASLALHGNQTNIGMDVKERERKRDR